MIEIKDFIYNSYIEGITLGAETSENVYNPINYYYLKVPYSEAQYLEKQGIHFEGTIRENKLNVIRINIEDREQTEKILLNIRNNSIKNKIDF